MSIAGTRAMSEIVIFEDDAQSVEVRLENETVWLSQEKMAQLFERDRTVIGRHIRNLFRENELAEESNVQKNARFWRRPADRLLQPGCHHLRGLSGQIPNEAYASANGPHGCCSSTLSRATASMSTVWPSGGCAHTRQV